MTFHDEIKKYVLTQRPIFIKTLDPPAFHDFTEFDINKRKDEAREKKIQEEFNSSINKLCSMSPRKKTSSKNANNRKSTLIKP